jgi:hypothetical protein
LKLRGEIRDSIVTPTGIGFSELNHKLLKLHVFVFRLKVGYNPDLVIQGQRVAINQEFDAATPNAKRYVVPASGERFASVIFGELCRLRSSAQVVIEPPVKLGVVR